MLKHTHKDYKHLGHMWLYMQMHSTNMARKDIYVTHNINAQTTRIANCITKKCSIQDNCMLKLCIKMSR